MAELQTASAAISIAFNVASLAQKAVKLIKKVIEAETEAQALQHRIEHVGNLAGSAGRVLRYRKRQRGATQPSPAENGVIKIVEESLVECRKCLQLINNKLKPYYGGRDRGPIERWSRGFKFVNSESFIKSQEDNISNHIQSLTVSVTLLNTLDHIDADRQHQEQNQYLRGIWTLAQAIHRQVVDEQSSLFDQAEVDPSPSQDDHEEDDEESSGDGTASEASDFEVDLTRRCSECWKRNLPMPDTPLAIAVKREQAEIVRTVLESSEDKDVRVRDAEDWTLLHYASHKVDYPTLCVLLESSVGRVPDFVNATSKQGQTALMHAAKQVDAEQSLELAKELISHECDIDIEDDTGRSALYFAVDGPKTHNRERFVDLLVGKGATKATVQDKLPEKASFYPALREEPMKRERTRSTSSITRKLSRAFSKSDPD